MLSLDTNFKGLSRDAALAVLVLLAVAIAALLAISFNTVVPEGAANPESGDLALYGHIADRLRQGQDYYHAMHAELLAGNYPTLSVFNWRTPLHLSLVALAPSSAVAQTVFAVLAGLIAAGVLVLLRRQGNALLVAGGLPLLLMSLAGAITPQTVDVSEIVAGVVILGSLCCYGFDRRIAGMAMAVAALFLRELAGPYLLLCLAYALWQRRAWEVAVGVAGLVVFAIYLWLHAQAVAAQLGPADIHDTGGWLAFGGLRFVLTTANFDGMFMMAPLWVTALVLPLGLFGLFAFPAGIRMGLMVAGYVVLFVFVGRLFNDYWGAIYTPPLAIGLAWAPFALRDLLQALRQPRLAAVK